MIYIFSSKNAAALKRALPQKNAWAEVFSKTPAENDINADEQIYLDVSGLSNAALKKTIASLNNSGAFWGVIDPKGIIEDPASFFFQGACDYIGKDLVKKGLDKKRFAEALSWAESRAEANKAEKTVSEAAQKKKDHVLPTGKFAGWKKIRAGTKGAFFFLFVSVSGKSNLRSMIGETAFGVFKKRLRDFLQKNFKEQDALLWIETDESNLFLVPPRSENIHAAIEKALKIIINSRLIGVENLGMSIPVDFTFALHYGNTTFQAPGKTGAIISESVNFVFHLGSKKAEAGRLTISDAVPEEAIPKGFLDLFRSAGVLEGIHIRHSRRFVH